MVGDSLPDAPDTWLAGEAREEEGLWEGPESARQEIRSQRCLGPAPAGCAVALTPVQSLFVPLAAVSTDQGLGPMQFTGERGPCPWSPRKSGLQGWSQGSWEPERDI